MRELRFSSSPTRFGSMAENGKLSGVECIRMELGEPDQSGRRRPVAVKGSEFKMPVDTVITALGQATQISFSGGIGVSAGKGDTITVDPATGATNVEGVFAGGDVTTGPAYVVDAIAAGKKAARSIGRYLKGEEVAVENNTRKPEQLSEAELETASKRVAGATRLPMPEEEIETRIGNFSEVALGYAPEDAMKEASRCLAGQIVGCIQCGECEKRCEVESGRLPDEG